MAISKLRIKELIEQGATIYTYSCVQPQFIIGIDTSIYKNKEIIGNVFYCGTNILKLEEIFETKEDADFSLEFQNITQINELNLPIWEDIKYTKHYFIYKFPIKDNYDFFGRIIILKDYSIRVCGLVQGVLFEEYFNEPSSKENYLEACKIAKKLFLGEESK